MTREEFIQNAIQLQRTFNPIDPNLPEQYKDQVEEFCVKYGTALANLFADFVFERKVQSGIAVEVDTNTGIGVTTEIGEII